MTHQYHCAIVTVILAVLALNVAGPAAAQRISERNMERFDAYVMTEPVIAAREAHLIAMRDMRFPDCAETPTYERVLPSRAGRDDYLWSPVAIGAFRRDAEAPEIAIWYETYEVNYCGNPFRENAGLYILRAGDAPRASWEPPGFTMAGTEHLDDIVNAIRGSGTSSISYYGGADCGEEFSPQRVVRYTQPIEAPDGERGELHEQWSISYCGIDEEFDVTFTVGRDRSLRFTAVEIDKPAGEDGEPSEGSD